MNFPRLISILVLLAVVVSTFNLETSSDLVRSDFYSLLPELPKINSEDIVRFQVKGEKQEEAIQLLRDQLSPFLNKDTTRFKSLQELCELLSDYRALFLQQNDVEFLSCTPVTDCLSQHLSTHFNSQGFSGEMLVCDPLLLSSDGVVSSLTSNLLPDNLVVVEIAKGTTTLDINNIVEQVKQAFPAVSIQWSGFIRFAESSKERVESEFAILGALSLFVIILLLRIVFRSFRPLGIAVLSSLGGYALGAVLCIWIFDSVHVITLTLGGSLLGACVDYAIHWISERYYRPKESQSKIWHEVSPVLRLGMYTSLLALLPFAFSSSPLLKEFLVFCCGALAGSYFVLSVLPLPKTEIDLEHQYRAAVRFISRLRALALQPLSVLLVGVLTIFGASQLKVNDDIRLLQNPPAELVEIERSISDGQVPSALLVIEKDSEEVMLKKLSNLFGTYARKPDHDSQSAFISLPFQLPNFEQQNNARELYIKYLKDNRSEIEQVLSQFGISLSPYAADQKTLDFELLRSLVPEIISQNGDLMIPVVNWKPGMTPPPGVKAYHYGSEISQRFESYRNEGFVLLVVGYFLVASFLLARSRDLRALYLLLPCAIAALTTVAVLSLAGFPLNFFTFVVLALILGLSVDYAVFFSESNDQKPVSVSILLSSATTVVAFLPLLLSDTALLQSVGLQMIVGVVAVTVVSPMVVKSQRSSAPAK